MCTKLSRYSLATFDASAAETVFSFIKEHLIAMKSLKRIPHYKILTFKLPIY
jgi:hypothetical protein